MLPMVGHKSNGRGISKFWQTSRRYKDASQKQLNFIITQDCMTFRNVIIRDIAEEMKT